MNFLLSLTIATIAHLLYIYWAYIGDKRCLKHRTIWYLVYAILYLVMIFSVPSISSMWLYIYFIISILYLILFYTKKNPYFRYLEDWSITMSWWVILVSGITIMAIIGDYSYYSTWRDLGFEILSSLWIMAHIIILISPARRKLFFNKFYLIPSTVIVINLLYILDMEYFLVWMSYGIFFMLYLVFIAVWKYIYRWKKW